MSTDKLRMPSYGGQALIEGVLMRGSRFLAAAVRTPDGKIVTKTEQLGGLYTSRLAKIPFLRGIVILWDALGLGTQYLTYSANQQGGEEEKIEGSTLYLTLAFSLLIAVALFFVTPAAIAQLIEGWTHWGTLSSNLIEGLIRLLLIVGYIYLVGLMPDVRRVFGYHGAEHKTINAFEAGANLTPEEVSKYSTLHPRCGTAFLLVLVIFSIIAFALLGDLSVAWRILSRIIFLPVLAMLAYEYIRWTASHLDNSFVRTLAWPSLQLQKLTTRNPSLDMLEVSILAFTTMYNLENPSPSLSNFDEKV
jgi:uncharacterized protein YqhQ